VCTALCLVCCCSWSSISRRERYIKRCTEAGQEAPLGEEQQLLPGEAHAGRVGGMKAGGRQAAGSWPGGTRAVA
jgi:hypothetical protein